MALEKVDKKIHSLKKKDLIPFKVYGRLSRVLLGPKSTQKRRLEKFELYAPQLIEYLYAIYTA